MLVFSVLAILSFSMYSIANVNGQVSVQYKLGVPKGYQAEYVVVDPSYSFTLGDIIRFEVTDIGLAILYNRDNSVAFSFEYAYYRTYINDVEGSVYLPFPTYGGYAYPIGSPPFVPAGIAFWNAMSRYGLPLKVTYAGRMIIIQAEVFFHYETIVGNETLEEYSWETAEIAVEISTGVMLTYQYTARFMYSDNYSYEYTYYLTLSRVAGTSPLTISPQAVLYLSILLPLGLIILVAGTYAIKNRTTKTGKNVKESILSALSNKQLLALAKTIPGVQANSSTGRTTLVKIIKENLSVEQLRRQVH